MAQAEEYYHWSHTASEVRFLMLDGKCAITFPIVLLHASKLTFGLMIGTCVMFWLLERNGISLIDFFRIMRLRIGSFGARRIVITNQNRSSQRADYFRYGNGYKPPVPTE